MDPVIVVGAGLSGVTCARTLHEAGIPVVVLDRGRRIGGRMASRRFPVPGAEERATDLGASYLTVSDPRFGAVVDGWERAGLAHPWTDTFDVLEADGSRRTTSGPLRWGTAGGMRSLVEHHAAGLSIESVAVTSLTRDDDGPRVDGRPTPVVVLAMPDPQARVLLRDGWAAEAATLVRPFEPVLALTAWWPERSWDLDGLFVNGDLDLAWVADDGRRRGDGAPVLVAHTTPARASQHLADPPSAGGLLLDALARVTGVSTPPGGHHVHRWSLARPVGERPAPYLLTASGLGVCGDGWGEVSRVEGAYLSGLALGEALVARLAESS